MNAKTLSKFKIYGTTKCTACVGSLSREHYADILLEITGEAYTGPCYRCRWDAFVVGIAQHFLTHDLTRVLEYYRARRGHVLV